MLRTACQTKRKKPMSTKSDDDPDCRPLSVREPAMILPRWRPTSKLSKRSRLPLYRAGHVPMIGEWVALPLLEQAGSAGVGDPLYDEIVYPVANRLLARCDAVLRLPGKSKGADEDVRLARERNLPVYFSLGEVPGCDERHQPRPDKRHEPIVTPPPSANARCSTGCRDM